MSKEVKATAQHFWYLDLLRESGKVNMLGAAALVARDFNIAIEDAREILSQWIRNFSERQEQT